MVIAISYQFPERYDRVACRPAMSTYILIRFRSIPLSDIYFQSLLGSSGDREDTYCAFSAEYRATFRKIRNTRRSFSDARGSPVPRVQYAFSRFPRAAEWGNTTGDFSSERSTLMTDEPDSRSRTKSVALYSRHLGRKYARKKKKGRSYGYRD